MYAIVPGTWKHDTFLWILLVIPTDMSHSTCHKYVKWVTCAALKLNAFEENEQCMIIIIFYVKCIKMIAITCKQPYILITKQWNNVKKYEQYLHKNKKALFVYYSLMFNRINKSN